MDASRRKWLFNLGKVALVVVGGVYALRSCDSLPGSATEAWDGPADDEEDIRRWALAYAVLAPSPSNKQPWKVDLRGADDLIRLYIDEERLLPEVDPFARQTGIAHGGFIESLVIAASHKGYRAEVTYFPEGSLISDRLGANPLADIRLVKDDAVQEDPLFEYLLLRRSNGQFYQSTLLETAHRDALQQAMTEQNIAIDFITKKSEVDEVRLLAAKAVGVEMTNLPTMQETIANTRIGAGSIDDARDGNALNGLPIWWLKKMGRLSEENAATPGSMGYNAIFLNATSHFLATPAFVLFESAGNSREGQLAMGRAYLRFNLLATQLGVSVQPVNQLLGDYEAMTETRAEFYHALNKTGYRPVQMLVRIGYALEDVPAPTARRPVDDILITEDEVKSDQSSEGEDKAEG